MAKPRKPARSPKEFLAKAQLECIATYFRVYDYAKKADMTSKGLVNALANAAEKRFKEKIKTAEQFWGNLEIEAALKELGYRYTPLQGPAYKAAREAREDAFHHPISYE
jgi:hypothetical protein